MPQPDHHGQLTVSLPRHWRPMVGVSAGATAVAAVPATATACPTRFDRGQGTR
jgi:hypothetical protein